LTAALGPWLRTWMLKVTGWPEIAGDGFTLLLSARSAPAVTVVVTLPVLLSGSGSGVLPACTRALLTMLPLAAVTRARKVKLLLPPLASAPAWVAVMLPLLKVQPLPLKLLATYCTAAGSVSTTLKPAEALGPALRTVMV
jgi:hypothetical protein